MLLVMLCRGAGKFSLDHAIWRRLGAGWNRNRATRRF